MSDSNAADLLKTDPEAPEGEEVEPFIGVSPEYRNYANEVDAPLLSEDPDLLELEMKGIEYGIEAKNIQPNSGERPEPFADMGKEEDAPAEPDEEPDDSWTKAQIEEYLDGRGIGYNQSMTKAELLELV